MKRIVSLLLLFCIVCLSSTSLVSCFLFNDSGILWDCGKEGHLDQNADDYCDSCDTFVAVVIDFYVVNDLHGKFCDTDTQPGVDELGSYLSNAEATDDNVIILSSGDSWQGTAESNLTGGNIITEWMNEMNFSAMTLGNHEFDWGEDAIRDNLEIAEFPFLAINVYDRSTGKLADYCTPSIMIDVGGVQVGIIGAIGDCYSSISYDKVSGLEFKVGNELTLLVRNEANRLRENGADLIVYSLHDGYGDSSGGVKKVSGSELRSYYAPTLSDGIVDIVFEAHTHQNYTLIDSYGVYHLQAGGENKGISHAEISVNTVSGRNRVNTAEYVRSREYSSLADNQATEELEDKYSDIIDYSYLDLGVVSKYYDDSAIENVVAGLYLKAGLEKWGSKYDIFLAGGFLRTRSPYNLSGGSVTYADLLSLFPFDNNIVLCSIKGYKLKKQFVNNTNSDYHTAYSTSGSLNINNISDNQTYYVVVDTYTALYAYNELTIIEYYDHSTFARDLLAEAVMKGDL